MDAANIDLKGFTEGFYKNSSDGQTRTRRTESVKILGVLLSLDLGQQPHEFTETVGTDYEQAREASREGNGARSCS